MLSEYSAHFPPEHSRRRESLAIAWAWYFVTALSALIGYAFSERVGLLVAGSVLVIGGSVAFVRYAHDRVTATGVYFLSVAILVGAPAVYLGLTASDSPSPEVFEFTLAVAASTALLYSLVIRGITTPLHQLPVSSQLTSHRTIVWLASSGVAFTLAGVAIDRRLGFDVFALTRAVAAIGMIAIASSALLSLKNRVSLRGAILAVAAVGAYLLYYVALFSGFGRLVIAGLALAAIMIATTVSPKHWHKPAILAMTIPAMLLAGVVGITRGGGEIESVGSRQILVEGRGLGSWISPVTTAAELIARDRQTRLPAFSRQYGVTYAEAAAIPIPRLFWPAKPVGFGTRLAELFAPAYVKSGYSMAATAYGEAYVNFGWLGILLLGAIVYPALSALDRWQLRLAGAEWNTPMAILLMLFAVVAAGIPDFVWGGLASTIARAGVRALILLGLYGIAVHLERRRIRNPRRVGVVG